VDLTPTTEQQQIVDAVRVLLERHGATARAKALLATDGYDDALDARLDEAGFTDVSIGEDTGPVESALVTLEIPRSRSPSPACPPTSRSASPAMRAWC
jgi:hypothetical protein